MLRKLWRCPLQDAPGPIARHARDAALMYDVLAQTSYYAKVSRTKNLAGRTFCYFNMFEVGCGLPGPARRLSAWLMVRAHPQGLACWPRPLNTMNCKTHASAAILSAYNVHGPRAHFLA